MTAVRLSDPVRPFAVTHGTVFRLAVPMTLAYLSTPLVGAVDTAIIGQLGSAALIGGVAIGAVIFDVLFASFNFLRGATTGLTAQAVGAGDPLEQQSVLFRALLVALAAALLMLLLQSPLAAFGVWTMGVEGEVAEVALAYFFVRIWSAPFALVNYALLGWVLGRGEALFGLLLQTILNGINIAVSAFLVLAWGWGVEGAALGTVIAEAAAAGIGLGFAAWKLRGAPLPSRGRVFDLARLRRMMGINSAMLVRSFSLLFAFAFFTRQGAQFGAVTLAANAVLMHFFLVGGYFLDGFATAAEQLAGRAVSARYRPAFDRRRRADDRLGPRHSAGAHRALRAARPFRHRPDDDRAGSARDGAALSRLGGADAARRRHRLPDGRHLHRSHLVARHAQHDAPLRRRLSRRLGVPDAVFRQSRALGGAADLPRRAQRRLPLAHAPSSATHLPGSAIVSPEGRPALRLDPAQVADVADVALFEPLQEARFDAAGQRRALVD